MQHHTRLTSVRPGFAAFAAVSLLPLALAQTAPAPTKPEEKKPEDIVLLEKFSVQDRITDPAIAIGADTTRNNISITREALLAAPAGISGLKMLESLPGFNVQTSDALGLYEFGNSVFVRAFNFQQIGFVLDGIPMGRSDQFGGSPIYRYVDNENLGRVTASQGTGEVSQPSYASLGPIVAYSTISPSLKPGLTLVGTAGSNSLERTFVKVQSGEWAGFSAYLSRSNQESNQWRGPGTFSREHWDGKARYKLSPAASFQFTFTHNDYFDYDSPSISKAQYYGTAGDIFGRKGRYFGYLGYVPDLPETTAGIKYSNTAYNQYYQQAINARTDTLYSLSTALEPMAGLKVAVTGYYEDKKGYGVSPEAYATSLASYNAERLILPGLFAPKGLQYGLSGIDGIRKGVSGSVAFKSSLNTVEVAAWVEKDDYHRTQNRYNQEGGNPAGAPLMNEPVHRQRDYKSITDTLQLSLKDTLSLAENRLKLEFGLKALDIDYTISGVRNPGDYIALRAPTIKANWNDYFLPQVGLAFNLSQTEQLFTSYAENFARPRGADDIFSAASPTPPAPAAEISKNAEIGFRTTRSNYHAVIAAYATEFDNRLQAFASIVPGTTTTETFYQNVGRVTSYGAEVSAGWHPTTFKRLAFTGNVTYNHSEFKDNYSTLLIAGKRVPDNAEWLIQSGVTYEPVPWAVTNLSAKYLSARYTNFINSESTGGYTTFAAYLDLGGDKLTFGALKGVKVRLNVDNIFDKDYFGTIGTTTNTLATFRPGPDRTWQLTVSASF
jgi:iron complex outermembrane receptor protein